MIQASDRVSDPNFRLSSRAQNRLNFVNNVGDFMSTSAGRIAAVLALGALLMGGGCAIQNSNQTGKTEQISK